MTSIPARRLEVVEGGLADVGVPVVEVELRLLGRPAEPRHDGEAGRGGARPGEERAAGHALRRHSVHRGPPCRFPRLVLVVAGPVTRAVRPARLRRPGRPGPPAHRRPIIREPRRGRQRRPAPAGRAIASIVSSRARRAFSTTSSISAREMTRGGERTMLSATDRITSPFARQRSRHAAPTLALGLEALPGRRVLGELEGGEHPRAPDLADEGVAGELAHAGLEVGHGVLPAVLHDPLGAEDPDVLERDRARDGVPGPGEAVEELAAPPEERLGDPVVHHDPPDRHIARRKALRDRHQVGVEPVVLGAEPGAGAPEAADYLVGDEEHPVLAADAGDLRPVRVRRHDHPARALDRLRDERRHPLRPEVEDPLLDGPRRLEPELVRGPAAASLYQ